MTFTLSESIKEGQKIKTSKGWRKVKKVEIDGVVIKEGLIAFGSIIYGWKAS